MAIEIRYKEAEGECFGMSKLWGYADLHVHGCEQERIFRPGGQSSLRRTSAQTGEAQCVCGSEAGRGVLAGGQYVSDDIYSADQPLPSADVLAGMR